ncbi:MAG: hypothetical protein ABS95_00900 [Verrucomicrobia bacterium SCN 57-15]|nr:MAG: hypothetical protein ABS95_00900 [Verrucomicrobia bacterium SCN 57-15]
MKKVLILTGCVAVVAALAFWQMRTRSAPSATPALTAEYSTSNGALGVETLMKNVDNYRGNVFVEGVVSAVSTTNQMLAMIDLREFQACGLEQCAEFTLPVRWAGTMPAVGQAVRAEGDVQETRGKFVFVAKALEKRGPQEIESK